MVELVNPPAQCDHPLLTLLPKHRIRTFSFLTH